ncbi:MAG: glycosyltransferase family 4 protein [Armatimonadetes bacterium]|nr:glycosyltransferase family 4 protein [Armatimonadota bacterium]
MSRIKVAYFNHTGAVGGAETSLGLLLRYIDKSSVQVRLFCPQGPLSEMASGMGVDVERVAVAQVGYARGLPQILGYAVGSVGSAARLAASLRSFAPDVVHANTIRAGFIAGLAKPLIRRRCRLVVHLRDCMPVGLQSRLVGRVLRRRADVVVAISRYVADRAVRAGIVGETVVVPNGVELYSRAEAGRVGGLLEELGVSAVSPVFAAVGQITPWKGQLEVIRAFGMIAGEFPEAALLIVGEAKFSGAESRYDTRAYERQLREEVSALGLDGRVVFTGERRDVPAVMRASDAVVLGSWEEPFGRVLIEAMAAGKPVIATRAGGVPEIVSDGETGILVEPRDPGSMADAMRSIAADADLRQRMGLRGAGRAAELFDIRLSVSSIAALYERLVAEDEGRDSQ